MPYCGEAEVKPKKQWKHSSGRTASIYGSVPYVSEADKAEWEVVDQGFTIYWHGDGTVCYNGEPFKDEAEAQAFADDWNAKRKAKIEAAKDLA
jgi:hypothetical protein